VVRNVRPMRRMNRRHSNGDPDPRPTVHYTRWLAIVFAISVAAMVGGGGVFLWAVYRDSPSPGAVSVGATLFVFGFSAVVVCFGVWAASSGYRRPRSGPSDRGTKA
jgi:membrane protein implicated in regulation of membrane protease activity